MDQQTLQETATLQARDESDAGWSCVVHLTIFVLYVFVWRCLRFRCEVLELKNNMLLYIFFGSLLIAAAQHWLATSWKEEVEKKRKETEELQNKLQEASAMQALK